MAVIVMFMEAPSFPMIFESATAGFEEWTPTCETLMILSISGGGILPVAFGKLTEIVGISKAWGLEAACFAIVLSYPLALCLVPSYRTALDLAAFDAGGDGHGAAVENPDAYRSVTWARGKDSAATGLRRLESSVWGGGVRGSALP